MNEIVEKKDNQLLTQDDVKFLCQYDEISKRYQHLQNKLRQAGKEYLEANNLDQFEVSKDGVTVRFRKVNGYTKKQCDTKRMKEEGVYDLYTKDVYVNGTVKFEVEYADD